MISSRRLTSSLFLVVLSLALWSGLTHRWSMERWMTPLQLQGDPLEVYARVQASKDDLAQPLSGFGQLPRLGAPVGADWSRYPISDRVVFTALGLLARGVGVFAAVNLAMAVVHALNALAFFLCARFLRWRWEWAIATALLFSFCSYNFRWGVTVSFSLTFFVPVLVLLCAWIARAAPAVAAARWTWVAGALGAWLGGANPYLSFFASQLVVGAMGLQLLRKRDFARCRAGVVFVVVLGISFFLQHSAYFFAKTDGEPRLTLSRNYAGSEIYALKLADLVIPAADHPLPMMAQTGRALHAQSALRSEFFVNYLGVAGIVGFGLLLWSGVGTMVRQRRIKVPDAFIAVIWTLLFSAVGGVNSLLALGGFDLFRASNRNSIFILVWSLFVFGNWCQRRWRPTFPLLRFGLPALVVFLGLADALPKIRAERTLRANGATLDQYRSLMASLEARLGSNASIFQVPTPVFPEAGPTVKMPDYELFLPYLTSQNLRFSYGALRGTALSRSLRSLARLPAAPMKDELEATGFSAIWIDRRGLFEDGDSLIEGFRQLGLKEFAHPDLQHVVIFLLEPAKPPRALDLTNPRLFEPWNAILSLKQPELLVYDGWYDLERDQNRSWRWARRSASTGIVMPTRRTVELSFAVYSLERGELVLQLNGRELARFPTTAATRDRRLVPLTLPAGTHRLVWRFTGPVLRPADADGRRLGFAVENMELSVSSQESNQPVP